MLWPQVRYRRKVQVRSTKPRVSSILSHPPQQRPLPCVLPLIPSITTSTSSSAGPCSPGLSVLCTEQHAITHNSTSMSFDATTGHAGPLIESGHITMLQIVPEICTPSCRNPVVVCIPEWPFACGRKSGSCSNATLRFGGMPCMDV